jgi:hypothetical protein
MIDALRPVGIEYWPITPGRPNRSGNDNYHASYDKQRQCRQYRNGWYCTREYDHPLPHVAMGGNEAVAVWDQLWYADQNHDEAYPAHAVPTHGRRDLTGLRSRATTYP